MTIGRFLLLLVVVVIALRALGRLLRWAMTRGSVRPGHTPPRRGSNEPPLIDVDATVEPREQREAIELERRTRTDRTRTPS